MTLYRGKHNHLPRRISERVIDALLLRGHVANWSKRLHLQGKLSVTEHSVKLSPERALVRPLKIAFASDFHAGPTTWPGIFDDLFQAITAQQPDLLLLGGDFVSCRAEYISAFSSLLAACRPLMGKYAVFGNHDLWVDEAHLTEELQQAGVSMLVNRRIDLPAPFESVSICGIDDPWTGVPDFNAAFADARQTRILLMHAPDGLLQLGRHRFDAAFAGHTHGGQVALKDGTPIVLPNGPLCRQFHYGRFEIEQNGSLFVSRGVGCSTLPVRLNADPELVIVCLQ